LINHRYLPLNTQIVASEKKENYVLIIDEINRGNISKIFGELITLIEPSKRAGEPESLSVLLPYSSTPFIVPNNLYLICTMNTADHSLTALDTALRRRFDFEAMLPDITVLKDTVIKGIDLPRLLQTLNDRIQVLYDREH
ncbi:AAA domain-containing protein, partial [Escherichia coli]|nr:AAA domain-containing protein [Escherichia coli]